MLRAFSTAATGMSAQEMMVDVIANNLANVNTNGFKRSQINFQDLLYVKMRESGTEIASGIKSPGGLEVGNGVRPAATTKIYNQGEFENTGRKLDIAIRGMVSCRLFCRTGTKDTPETGAANECQRAVGYDHGLCDRACNYDSYGCFCG